MPSCIQSSLHELDSVACGSILQSEALGISVLPRGALEFPKSGALSQPSAKRNPGLMRDELQPHQARDCNQHPNNLCRCERFAEHYRSKCYSAYNPDSSPHEIGCANRNLPNGNSEEHNTQNSSHSRGGDEQRPPIMRFQPYGPRHFQQTCKKQNQPGHKTPWRVVPIDCTG